MLDTYLGEALAWEADDLGHLNMRFYFDRAAQARIFFMAHLGNTRIAKTIGASEIIAQTQHILYRKEIRPGNGMRVQSGVLSMGETDIILLHMVYKTPDILSACIVESLSHISSRTRQVFAWPKRVRERTSQFVVTLPQEAKPRNINPDEGLGRPSMNAADKLDLPVIGRGMFTPQECDVFGYVRPDAIIGRVSDCAQHLKSAWPDFDFSSDDAMSGALLEARANHRNQPKAGDLFVIRSGLRKAGNNTRELCHWILDPVSGKCWSSFIGVACRFNLKTRRLVKVEDDVLTLLQSGIVNGLKP